MCVCVCVCVCVWCTLYVLPVVCFRLFDADADELLCRDELVRAVTLLHTIRDTNTTDDTLQEEVSHAPSHAPLSLCYCAIIVYYRST